MTYTNDELSGNELDTAVAIALGAKSNKRCSNTDSAVFSVYDIGRAPKAQGCDFGESSDRFGETFEPSQNWKHGGPLIERYGICLKGRVCMSDPSGYNDWTATVRNVREPDDSVMAHASSPLVAAMRALVALKLSEGHPAVISENI